MKKLAVLFLIFILLCTAVQATGAAASTDTELTDTLPPDTDLSDDVTKTFLNINIWMFSFALILFIICTVGVIICKTKKSGT